MDCPICGQIMKSYPDHVGGHGYVEINECDECGYLFKEWEEPLAAKVDKLFWLSKRIHELAFDIALYEHNGLKEMEDRSRKRFNLLLQIKYKLMREVA